MKFLQAVIVLFAVIGCLALALGGFYIYSSSKGGGENFLTKFRQARTAETTGTVAAAPAAAPAVNSEYASVIKDYQPTPTPAPVAAAPAAAVPGQPVAAQPVVGVASAPAALAIKTPAPNAGKIRDWPSGKKWVALTYDDGPHPEWTPKMIELLRSKNVKATFFLLGNMLEKHPEIGKAVADNGFEVGNHTFSHSDFNTSKMTPDKIREELTKTNALIAQYVTTQKIRNMRPPYGNTGPKKLEPVAEEMGLNIVCWNIDTDDWKRGITADQMADNIMKNLGDGAIILMHDKHEKAYDCTAKVIDQIRAKGYEFVTVSELLGLTQPGAAPQPVAAAPVAAAPVAAAPAAVAPANAALPAPAAAGAPAPTAPAPANSALPAPAAAVTPQAVPGLDPSKITQPPPTKN